VKSPPRLGALTLILAAACGIFAYLGAQASIPKLPIDRGWLAVLASSLLLSAALGGWALWKTTRFS